MYSELVEVIRACARPAIGIIFAAAIAVCVIWEIDVPQWFLGMAIPCITWWFAERAITHNIERKKEE